MKQLHLSVDFDGTIVSSNYPDIGKLMTGAKETINKWYSQGHIIIINTCRTGAFLSDCEDFLHSSGINYHLINENNPELIKIYGMDTRKISADVYIDDKAAGGFAGWEKIDEYVERKASRKPVIICIIGGSGSGKTTLANYIELNFGVKMIDSRTTRAPRKPNEEGHIFVSDAEFDTYLQSEMLAFTDFGGNRYCCLTSDVREENTYVIDERGFSYLKAHFSDVFNIRSILVACNRDERIRRVGLRRVKRDDGNFKMKESEFDFVWRTDTEHSYEELHKFINKSLDRWI